MIGRYLQTWRDAHGSRGFLGQIHWPEYVIGIGAGLLAMGIRAYLPLTSTQLPTTTVIVAVALTGTFVGLRAGIAAALTGALLAFKYLIKPSLAIKPDSYIPLVGFAVIAIVLLMTSYLYRRQMQHNHKAQFEAARKDAEVADLFARELAHRLKNALAVVQAIAQQTLPKDDHQRAFAARLTAMANAHDLLTEHAAQPTAKAEEVIDRALKPFLNAATPLDFACDSGLQLAGSDVVSLSLALHELATNACKYGAWHEGEGRVAVNLRESDDTISFSWKEHDGPPIGELTRKGFGTKLLGRIGITPALDLEPDGLRFSTTFSSV